MFGMDILDAEWHTASWQMAAWIFTVHQLSPQADVRAAQYPKDNLTGSIS